MLYLLPVRSSCVCNPCSLAFPKARVNRGRLEPMQGIYQCFLFKRVRLCVVVRKKIKPRSRKERRYISERIGISLRSTLRHNFLSCSRVRVGGGGKDDSPPKSTLMSEEELFRFSFSSFRDGECAFSSDMVEDRSGLGKRSIRRKEFKHGAPVRLNLTRAGVRIPWGSRYFYSGCKVTRL